MADIEIPFSREMAIAAVQGRKVATTRSEKKGEIGDIFKIQDPEVKNDPYPPHVFRIIDIWPGTWITTVRNDLYRLEGFDSPEAFEKTRRSLHRGHFTKNKDYVVHFFGRIE